MKSGTVYSVAKKIKLHTKPIVEVEVVQVGEFIKETPSYLYFRNFKVRKANVLRTMEL